MANAIRIKVNGKHHESTAAPEPLFSLSCVMKSVWPEQNTIAEIPLLGIAPAIGNAIFNATGRSLRSLPVVPDGLPSS